jgi:predicted alpha/beta superfamily hydrolase
VGESLAGLFVLETLFLEPDLFKTYIAFDPSLWWNKGELVKRAAERMPGIAGHSLYFASSNESEMIVLTRQLAESLALHAPRNVAWHYETMPDETHATIYHPAALRAFRYLFKPASSP